MLNTGESAYESRHRLLSTVGYRLGGKTTFALEGSIFMAGASVQWLRDTVGLVPSADESAVLAASLESNDGVYLVPAFTGLGAPHWNPHTRGTLLGMTRDTGPAHIARAVLEAVCYQSYELLEAMADDVGEDIEMLRIDGGMANNNWLAQYLADITRIPVAKPALLETTALGAARLAGLQAGVFDDLNALQEAWIADQTFDPSMSDSQRRTLLSTWQRAVSAAIAFSEDTGD